MAQLKQIAKAAQSTRADVGFPARAHAATMTFVPVSPLSRDQRATAVGEAGQHEQNTAAADTADRKSTRLNSSHTVISYAVFCLKKKKKGQSDQRPWATDMGAHGIWQGWWLGARILRA